MSQFKVVHTPHAQLLERIDTAGLQQLSHNPVRLLETLLQQYYAPALVAERNRCGASDNARPNNDNVCLMML
jgi:hypothetical protein